MKKTSKLQKKLRLRVVRESVDSNWLRTMANAAGLASNADDGNELVLLEYVLDRERNVMVLQRPAVSNAALAAWTAEVDVLSPGPTM